MCAFFANYSLTNCFCQDWLRTVFSKQEWSNWTLTYLLPTIQTSHGRKSTYCLLSSSLSMMNMLSIHSHFVSRCKVILWLNLVHEHSVFYKSATFLTINNDCCVNSFDWWPTLHVTGVLAFINITHFVNNKDTVKNVGFYIPLVNTLRYRTSFPCL